MLASPRRPHPRLAWNGGIWRASRRMARDLDGWPGGPWLCNGLRQRRILVDLLRAPGLVAAYALGLSSDRVHARGRGCSRSPRKKPAKMWEGASMFPEAGGSSSFARHAFNELVSFFAGWALSLDYILTIAISAFFVPHYLQRVLARTAPSAGRRDRRDCGDRLRPGRPEHPRDRGVGETELHPRRTRPGNPGPDHPPRRDPYPESVAARPPGSDLGRFRRGARRSSPCRWRCSPTRGSRRVPSMAEEARDPGRDVPRAVNLILIAVLGVYVLE